VASPEVEHLPRPRAVTAMFAGFKSRWITPRSCAASSASQTCSAYATASRSVTGPRATNCAMVWPRTSSMTRKSSPSCASKSYTVAIAGCSSCESSRASSRSRRRASALDRMRGEITLSATSRSSRSSQAR
jgi:hypothetical protein